MRLTELKCWGGRDGYLVWELRYYHATTEFLLKREGIIAFSPRNRPSLLLVQDIYPAQGGGSEVVHAEHRENWTPKYR